MRAVLFFIIGLAVITTAAAASDWEEHSVTLKWGESVGLYGYNITAVDFRPGTIEEHPEKCGNVTKSNERKTIGCDDWVLLRIYKNGNHVLDAPLVDNNHTFFPVSIDGADFYNQTTYEDDDSSLKIIAQEVITGNTLPSPYAELDILVKTNETDFDIARNLTINKTVLNPANIYPSYQYIPVTIAVENIGKFNLSYIRVVDGVGDGFTSESPDLKWGISLHRGEMWQTQYLIKPLKPVAGAEYTLPPATLYVEFYNKTYNLSTGNKSFILHSSDIILSKTADKKAGNVTVNVSLKNNGSRAALVNVWDSLLPDMEIVSGELNFSIVLQPGNFYNNTYILKLNNISGNISLPSAMFTFKEYKPGYSPGEDPRAVQNITGSGISNPVEIIFAKAVSAQVQTTQAPAPSVEETSIEVTPAENLTTGALWISGYKIPYTYLIILAGVLLVSVILFMLKVWRLLFR
jgi:hypothetical protein